MSQLMGIKDNEATYRDLKSHYKKIYELNEYEAWSSAFDRLIKLVDRHKNQRQPRLRQRDQDELAWFKKNEIVGMTLYVDLFSEDLEGFEGKIHYLKALGVNFIHFMPILEGREGENDGGYAVKDYKAIDPKFGDFPQFEKLLKTLQAEGMYSCVDFVINHTAKEHEWAVKAMAGQQEYMDMYYMYENDQIPKAFEATMPEVFPKVSPGNFNYYEEIDRYVMTSFYEFQWDLNFNNPLVFEKIVDILLFLANKGIDMIRLDAIPFIWKALGSNCRNLPTIHLFLEMFHLIIGHVAPSVAILGEAIVEAKEIVGYYGQDQPECDVMYNAPMMVNIWNAIATRDATLLKVDMNELQIPEHGAWINYARCHDDIGWGFNEVATRAMGLDPLAHKQFLIKFYEGEFQGSFAAGELYEFDPKTMDARNCGTMASLCGLETGINAKDDYQQELALKRMHLINGLLLSTSGIPLIYSGDEVATLNNHSYKEDEKKAHDTRWLHRSKFDWSVEETLKDLSSASGQVYQRLQKLIGIRKKEGIFSGHIKTLSLELNKKEVLGTIKSMQGQDLICLYNFSESRQYIDCKNLSYQVHERYLRDLIQGKTIDLYKEQCLLGPYEYLWLTNVKHE